MYDKIDLKKKKKETNLHLLGSREKMTKKKNTSTVDKFSFHPFTHLLTTFEFPKTNCNFFQCYFTIHLLIHWVHFTTSILSFLTHLLIPFILLKSSTLFLSFSLLSFKKGLPNFKNFQ